MKFMGTETVTEPQIGFGKKLGLDLDGQSVGVAMARIGDEISSQFWGRTELGSPSQKQIELAAKFGFDISKDTRAVGSAIVDDIMSHLNAEAIEREKLEPGARVRRKGKHDMEYTISSIRDDGTVFFKGGNGRKAWARSLERVPAKERQPIGGKRHPASD
jgi:hypothetical protein